MYTEKKIDFHSTDYLFHTTTPKRREMIFTRLIGPAPNVMYSILSLRLLEGVLQLGNGSLL